MRYPATIIQSEYIDFAIWHRPAVRGWEVIIATQMPEKYRDDRIEPTRMIKTVGRKREIAAAIQEATQSALDSIQETLIRFGLEGEEWDVSIGQGFIEDDEMVH